MKKVSIDDHHIKSQKEKVREKIIGLGEGSARKSYYPQLLENIRELKEQRLKLIKTVSTLEQREIELENLVAEKSVLLEEIHHRVKNNFQIITSLLNLGRHTALGSSEAVIFTETSRRIQVMAQVYEKMLHSGMLAKVNICDLLRFLSAEAHHFYNKSEVRINYKIKEDQLYCGIDIATPLALIVNELISILYTCSFDDSSGILNIQVMSAADKKSGIIDSYKVRVFDSGSGIPESKRSVLEKHLGVSLIQNLCSQIEGDYRYIKNNKGNFNISFSVILKKDCTACIK